MRNIQWISICALAAVAGCSGGGSHDAASAPPAPAIALAATSPSIMKDGSAVFIQPTLTGVTGPVTWSTTPAGAAGLTDYPTHLLAALSASKDSAADSVTVTATAGGVSQSIQVAIKSPPPLVPYLTLPAVWTVIYTDAISLMKGNPVASAADKAGNLYLSYAAPVSEIKKVGTDGTITTFAHVDHPGSLAFGPNGSLYVVDGLGSNAFAIRRIAPDGTLATLTATGPFDAAKGTVDGPAGVATAFGLSLAVSPSGELYAVDQTRVRRIAPDGSFSTLAGGGCEVIAGIAPSCLATASVDGHGAQARFAYATGIVADAAGNLYVDDGATIRKVTPAGDVSTLAGTLTPAASDIYVRNVDGTGSKASFSGNGPIAIDASGNLYKLTLLTDGGLRKITPAGVVTTVATGIPFNAVNSQNNIVSLYAGLPGVVVLQSSAALIKVNVN